MAEAPVSRRIPFITLPNWIKAAAACGVNLHGILRDLGIEIDLSRLEQATIEEAQLAKLMAECVRLSPSRHFPLVLGDTYSFEYLADLETFITTSPTLREAAVVFDWVQALINPNIVVRLYESGSEARLVLQVLGERRHHREPTWFVEALFASIFRFGRLLIPPPHDFIELRMRSSAPPYLDACRACFGVPMVFEANEDAAVFPRHLLDQRLGGDFPSLHAQARTRIEQQLQRVMPQERLVDRIERALQRKPALLGLGADAMADELGLHLRSLQRRLAALDTRFDVIQARVRFALACDALADPQRPLEQISRDLGFADRRSFTRAFSRWSGTTPSAWRQTRLS
jgi:AraC-like DNA-binding protein